MLNTLHIQRGVTLIELMIGLVILAILLTLGAPSFSDWIQNTRIHNSAQSIVSGLQLARAEAVRRNAQVKFSLGASNDSGWTICSDTATMPCPAASLIQSHSSTEGSATGINVSAWEADAATNLAATGTIAFAGALIFNGLGRVTTATLTAGNNAVIDITNPNVDNCVSDNPPGTMRCLRIVVTSGGQIRMCNPALAMDANPQGC